MFPRLKVYCSLRSFYVFNFGIFQVEVESFSDKPHAKFGPRCEVVCLITFLNEQVAKDTRDVTWGPWVTHIPNSTSKRALIYVFNPKTTAKWLDWKAQRTQIIWDLTKTGASPHAIQRALDEHEAQMRQIDEIAVMPADAGAMAHVDNMEVDDDDED
jgi:hypothetical protein